MPRAGLTADKVVEAAEELADRVGLGNLTLSALAEVFDVRVPSLYKHVGGLPQLRRELAVRAKRDLAASLARAAAGRARADGVRALAKAYREWARQHPGRYAATLRAPEADDAPDLAASGEAAQLIFDVLAGYGLTDDAAIDATRTLRAALHGFVALEDAGGFGLPLDVDRSYAQLVDGLCRALASWPDRAP